MKPTITFIVPIQDQQDFLVEQINTIFKFSEQYAGFCEIIMPTDEFENPKVNLSMLAVRLNKINHPHVRTRTICFTQKLSLENLIETGLNLALGDKIVIVLNAPEKTENLKINDYTSKHIFLTQYILDADMLLKNLTQD